MNDSEVTRLLVVASGFDNRDVDDVNTRAWKLALRSWTYEICEQAIVEHFTDPATRHAYLTVGHLLDRLERIGRARTADIEADVRSAKARGIVDANYHPRQPLDAHAARLLAEAREVDRAFADRYAPEAGYVRHWDTELAVIDEQIGRQS